MDRKAKIAELFKKAKFCPICGGELRIFGTSTSDFKECDDHHGVVSIKGKRQGSPLGIYLEVEGG
jgi:hypothetical protein